ncbi:MAG: hypothetical protein IK071_07955 [Lachnospiraceae bacterium]|nr:hypothetical protein [Lachnospiraceae bacterium]
MGLLSKIFGGDSEAEKTAKDLLQGIFGGSSDNSSPDNSSSSDDQTGKDERIYSSPSGDSWGDDMPAEENQFNYNGSYIQYFENIFGTEFAAYRTEKTNIGSDRYIYTFYGGAGKALVVELMPESCSAYKIKQDCKKENIPYLRFYHDHHGWWNTRSYVVGRIGKILN